MEPADLRKRLTTSQEMKVFKPYLGPGLEYLSPAAAKGCLSRHADASDPEVPHMIECVEDLQGEKGS